MAISPDGGYVAGWCDLDAVRWSQGQAQALGRLPSPFNGLSVAYGISENGGTVVGFGRGDRVGAPFWGFIWREGVGMLPLGPAPSSSSVYGSYAAGVSADGQVVVGASDAGASFPRAFVLGPTREWGEVTNLPSTASGVSADGRVVVGLVNVEGIDTPFRWSEQSGLVLLGDLPGGDTGGIAYATNADGTVIVGGSMSELSDPSFSYEAFRWAAGVMMPLGDLPGGDYASEARAVSADGSVVVGYSSVAPSPRTAAFIWDPQRGMRDLRTVLINNYGLDLTGWQLTSAQAISADGRTIVGRGVNPLGQFEGWIAHLERRCRADWDEDGVISSADFFAFLQSFLCGNEGGGCGNADFNEDGVENTDDFFEFVVAFFGVCS